MDTNTHNIPDYINEFIKSNFTKLEEIYNAGIQQSSSKNDDDTVIPGDGMLSFKCKQSENKMDVLFLNTIQILTNFNEKTWKELTDNRGDKRIFFIEDLDATEIYMIYV